VTISLTGDDLTVEQLVRVARGHEAVELAPEAVARIEAGRAVVEHVLELDTPVYGVTTGVGARKSVRVDPADSAEFNRMILLNHLVAQGDPAPEDVVRGTLVRLANGLAKGTAGVRLELAERLVRALNEGPLPRVRTLGSVGQADLPAMADVAHELVHPVRRKGRARSPQQQRVLDRRGRARGGGSRPVAGHDRHRRRARPRSVRRERLHAASGPGYLWDDGAARNLQDPLTFRCLPQVHGAARDALDFTQQQLAIELNASQENPLVVAGESRIVSVANFDVLPLAAALDFLRIALAPVLTSANERVLKLLQAPLTGLPLGLAVRDGLAENSLSEFGVPAQSLAAEARLLAQPVSFELTSSTHAEGIEDRMTMAPLAARRLVQMVELGERLVAIELVIAAQAVDLRKPRALGQGTKRAYELVRGRIPFSGAGEPVAPDLEPVRELVRSGAVT
jgi:histidine ammonia-lyase